MTTPSFNEELLALALDARGYTAAQLAEALAISPGLVSKWLHATIQPTEDRVVEIAKALKYPVQLFFRSERVRNSDSVCFHHRKRQSMPRRLLQKTEAEMHLTQLQAKWLLEELEIESSLTFLTLDPDDYGGPTKTAQALRSFWRVPPGPILNLTALVEAAGAIVVLRPFGTTKLDGMSCWAKNTPPLFFLNADLPTDRLRWTLAHELAHLTMHFTPPAGNPEVEAEDFAREFLLPAQQINPELRGLSFARLPALKHEWRVPMRELITAASRRELLPADKIKSLSVQFSRAGWHSAEKYEIHSETPTVLDEGVAVHFNDHNYSVEELAEVVGLLTPEFCRNYGLAHTPTDPTPERGGLRLVR